MRVVLHIGTDKTGSTSIQRHLTVNLDWFQANSIFIPATGFGLGNGHGALLERLHDDELDKLAKELEAAADSGFRSAVLSWEGMNFYPAKKIRRLQTILEKYSVSVLVYVREQAEIIQSGFLQQLKSNSNRTRLTAWDHPRTLTERMISKRACFTPSRDYYRLLQRWQGIFPEAVFLVATFDKKLLLNGDVVDDFLAQLGVAPDAAFERVSIDGNLSLDVETGLVVESWQADALPHETLLRLVDIAYSIISREGSATRYFLGKETVKSIRRHFRSSNKRLARDYMENCAYPFPNEKNCWREESFAAIEARADNFSRKVDEIDKTPTLVRTTDGAHISSAIELCRGWCAQVAWGVWSQGKTSVLRFRLAHRRMPPNCTGVRIVIWGRYYGDNRETSVTVNGKDYGRQRLARGHRGLELPIDLLLAYENIEIMLQHQRPVSPRDFQGGDDSRPIAFGLVKLGCMYIKSEAVDNENRGAGT